MRPRAAHLDCASAVQGVRAALADMGVSVEYYAPPSDEEATAAITGMLPGA